MTIIDLILIGVAFFLGYRLWRILGMHSLDKPIRRKTEDDDTVIPIRAKKSRITTSQSPTKATVTTQATNSKFSDSFNESLFLQGAEVAFRKIVNAYSLDDVSVLKKLLAPPVFETFEDTISKRAKNHQFLEIDLPRIIKTEVINRHQEKNIMYVTVKFISEQCVITRSASGKIIEGDPDHYKEITDIWTFSRDIRTSDPNWKLSATQLSEG